MAISCATVAKGVVSFRTLVLGAVLTFTCAVSFGQGVASASAPAAALPEIEFGYPEQPPRVFTNAQGQPEGQAIRMATALFAMAGIPWHAVSYPASRLFNNLDNGTTTFAVMVRSPALLNCCLLSKDPLYSTELKAYYIGDKPPIKSRNDLIGKRIITIRGYSYSGLITFINDPQNRIANEIAPTHEPAFDMLLAGRADYVLNYETSASVALNARPIANLRQDTVDRVETYIVLSKKYPNAEKVMETLEVILKNINASEFFKLPAK